MIKDTLIDGYQNAAHRSLYRALGLTEEEQRRPHLFSIWTPRATACSMTRLSVWRGR